MNIPKNVQEYINSLPPNQQKAAMNEIMRNQYSAYKNSPNQVNQQNMKTPIAPQAATSPELALPSKYSQEGEQESGNLQGNLQDMLVQYFEKMQFTEEQAKQFMQEFAKLSDEEKQQLVQELQQEIQGESMPEQSQEMPEEKMEEPMQEQSMMSGGRFPYMLKKKGKEKLQVGGIPVEEAKKIKDKAKQIRDGEANKSVTAANDAMIAASKNSSVVSSSSAATPVTATPVSGKKVIRLDNDYYEVDVDSKGAPVFTKDMSSSKLSEAKKQDYKSKYIFEEPSIIAVKPVLDVPKKVSTNDASAAKPPVKKVIQKPKPKGSQEVMDLQAELNNYGANIPVDGFIGNKTREAFYAADLSDEAREKYLNANPKLNKAATIGTPAYLALSSTGTQTTPAKPKVIAKQDSTKTATDSSFINKMFKDTLGVTIDTAKLQKPAPKKVITPPSMNKGTDTNGGIIQAQRQVEEGVKRGIKPRGLTGYEKIDRFQDDVSALSTAASLTGVGGLPAKVVDIADTALDAGQFAYAYATGNKPEMLNQGIQTGMRVVLPLAARGAGKAIQKYSPVAEEIGYRIGKSKVGEKIIAPLWNKAKPVYGKAKEVVENKAKSVNNTWEEYNGTVTPTLSYNQRKGVSLLKPIGEEPYILLKINPALQQKAIDAKKTISEIGDPAKATLEQVLKLKKAEEAVKEYKDHQDLIVKTNAEKRAKFEANAQLTPIVEKIPDAQMKKVMNEIESEVTFRPRVNMDTPLSAVTANEIVRKPGNYSQEAYKKGYDFLKDMAEKNGGKLKDRLPPVKTAMESSANIPVPKSMFSRTARPIPIGGKLPKLKTDGLGTEWEWVNPNVGKLIEEQEALLAKAKTLAEIRPIEENLKKLYKSKVVGINKTPKLSIPVTRVSTSAPVIKSEPVIPSAEAAATPAVLKPIVPTLLKPNKPASIVQQFNKNKSTNSKKPLYTRNKKQFGGYYFM